MLEVVTGLIFDASEQKILIAKRPPNKPYSGYWEFPGGKVEPDEPQFFALRRELHEELDINIIKAKFIFNTIHSYPSQDVNLNVWKIELYQGQPIPKEGQVLQWVDIAMLDSFTFPQANLEIISKINSNSFREIIHDTHVR